MLLARLLKWTVRFHGKQLVKMDGFVPGLFAFLVGLTASGLLCSALELVFGRRLAFAEPFMSGSHVVRSLALAAFAGPFMLFNEALAAYRQRHITGMALASCAGSACLWALALGVPLIGAISWAVEHTAAMPILDF